MGSVRLLTPATAVLLLVALPLVVAHGHGSETVGGGMEMADTPQPQVQNNDGPGSYWSLSEHTGLIYMHIALEMIAWFVVLPVGMSS